MSKAIRDNVQRVRKTIEAACRRVGRDPAEVSLLLATKTVSVEKIREALAAGEVLLGENRVQELQQKAVALADAPVEWHFIGHLQRNKVRDAVRHASCIHSVDRLRLGNRLHNRLTRENKRMDILVQVNTSYEESKFGVPPEGAVELVTQLARLETLRIRGLMTIGKFGAAEHETREGFRRLRRIRDDIRARNIPGVEMDELSMGMSGDLALAVEEGATIVRVGTAIFGERAYPDSYYWDEGGSR